MKILFLTLDDFSSVKNRGIYTDLMREFIRHNHDVYIISPTERRKKVKTRIIRDNGCCIVKPVIGNIQKTNILEKGISTIMLETRIKRTIKKYLNNVKFELVIYSTPPITFQKPIEYIKNRDNAKAYLLLKDIFPQNAIDLGLLKKTGVRRYIYKYFRNKERKLYNISDYIGCLSEANVEFLMKNNSQIQRSIVEVCPNSVELNHIQNNIEKINTIKQKYNLPNNKTIFVYGGNLGKPQGIEFVIRCMEENIDNEDVHFIIVGSGTEFNKIKGYIENRKPSNTQLFNQLPKDDYEDLVNCCDVGLVFLDHRFTIPNFPSRILSYMQNSMPVLAATDKNTDIGEIIEKGKFGLWCESNDVETFNEKLKQLCNEKLRKIMGQNSRKYLENNYTVRHSYEIIMSHFM